MILLKKRPIGLQQHELIASAGALDPAPGLDDLGRLLFQNCQLPSIVSLNDNLGMLTRYIRRRLDT